MWERGALWCGVVYKRIRENLRCWVSSDKNLSFVRRPWPWRWVHRCIRPFRKTEVVSGGSGDFGKLVSSQPPVRMAQRSSHENGISILQNGRFEYLIYYNGRLSTEMTKTPETDSVVFASDHHQ